MSKTLQELKDEIISYGKIAGAKNYTPGVSGNISARYGENVLITASGTANGYLRDDDFAVVDFAGNSLQGIKKPSSETPLHLEFYRLREDINYIIHVHSPYLSSFASCGMALDEPIMAENVFYFGKIPLAEYGLPSSWDLVEKTSKYFREYNAVLMANHGFIVGGKSIEEAYLRLELAESYAHVVFNTKMLGGAKLLDPKQVQEIFALR